MSRFQINTIDNSVLDTCDTCDTIINGKVFKLKELLPISQN